MSLRSQPPLRPRRLNLLPLPLPSLLPHLPSLHQRPRQNLRQRLRQNLRQRLQNPLRQRSSLSRLQ